MKRYCKKAMVFFIIGVMMFSFGGCLGRDKRVNKFIAKTYDSVEQFKDYDNKDTKDMQKITTTDYSVYIPKDATLTDKWENESFYKNNSGTIMLVEAGIYENILGDMSVKEYKSLKKKYGHDPDSAYGSLYIYFNMQTKKAMKKDKFAQEYAKEKQDSFLYERVFSYDNGNVKGFICKTKDIGMYIIELFSKDEVDYIYISTTCNYDTACKIANSITINK